MLVRARPRAGRVAGKSARGRFGDRTLCNLVRKVVSLAVVALSAGVIDLGGIAESAPPAASHIIDRTFGCTPTALTGKLRAFDVNAVPKRAKESTDPLQAPSPGFIGVASGGWRPDSELISIRARIWQRFAGTYSFEGVYASMGRCSSSRLSPPLTPMGLPSPPVRWAQQVTCIARGRVIVRLRAVLHSPSAWQPLGNFYDGARRKVVAARLVVHSERTGEQIAYMELNRNGETTLMYSPVCS